MIEICAVPESGASGIAVSREIGRGAVPSGLVS
jgi:hypothetical protein